MSKKAYWIIHAEAINEDFYTWYYNCPKCKRTSVYGMPLLAGMPKPNYCEYCGKRLYIKEDMLNGLQR